MKNVLIAFLVCLCFNVYSQKAQDTKIVVRTKAKDAKFIGSSMGGSMIIIRENLTDEILAKGLTAGGTGDTQAIMRTAKERYTDIHVGSASFETTLSLTKPVFVTIEAFGPVNHESRVMTSTQVWLIPGKHMDEQGIILEIPGFVIDGLFPQTHQGFSLENDKSVELRANMVMMCGCTISPNGLWDGNMMEVEAHVYVNGVYSRSLKMTNSATNTFIANLELKETGSHEVIITGFDPITKNTGVDQLNFRVNN